MIKTGITEKTISSFDGITRTRLTSRIPNPYSLWIVIVIRKASLIHNHMEFRAGKFASRFSTKLHLKNSYPCHLIHFSSAKFFWLKVAINNLHDDFWIVTGNLLWNGYTTVLVHGDKNSFSIFVVLHRWADQYETKSIIGFTCPLIFHLHPRTLRMGIFIAFDKCKLYLVRSAFISVADHNKQLQQRDDWAQ